MYAQLIDDDTAHTLESACTLKVGEKRLKNGGSVAAARAVGEAIAKKAKERGIETAVFDRGGYIYHGRVKALAEGAREAGLKF